jgi:hypothetical protein
MPDTKLSALAAAAALSGAEIVYGVQSAVDVSITVDQIGTRVRNTTPSDSSKLGKDLSALPAASPSTFDDIVLFQNGSTQYEDTYLGNILSAGKKALAYRRWEFVSFNPTSDDGMSATNAGTSSYTINSGSGTDAFGVVTMEPGTTSTGAAAVSCNNICRVTGGRVMVSVRYRITTLSTSTNRFTVRFGALDSVSLEPTNGIYFRQVDDVNGAKLQGVVRASNTETTVDLGVIPTANTWAHCHWIANAAGTSIQFYLNGTAAGAAVTTNIPTTINMRIGASTIASVGTSLGRELRLDWIDVAKEFTASRS